MNEEKTGFLTISDFAEIKKVPREAVILAIDKGRIKTESLFGATEPIISNDYLYSYEFNLIGVYDYAERMGVTFKAVYYRIDRGLIQYTIDEANLMKIDWDIYKDEHFRKFTHKHRIAKSK